MAFILASKSSVVMILFDSESMIPYQPFGLESDIAGLYNA